MEPEQDVTISAEALKALTSKGNTEVRNPAVLKKYPKVADMVKMFGEYDLQLSNYAFGRDPVFMGKLAQLAKEYNPSFNVGKYDVSQKARKDYTGQGQGGKNLTAINTAVGHFDTYLNDIEKEGNLSIGFLNSPRNWWRTEAQDDAAPNNVKMTADMLASELVKATRGGPGASRDVQDWQQNVSPNHSPNVQRGSAHKALELLSSRLAAERDNYMRDVGQPPTVPFLSKTSRETLRNRGYDPDLLEQGVKADKARLRMDDLPDAVKLKYLKKAGGDVAKAKALAKEDGFR